MTEQSMSVYDKLIWLTQNDLNKKVFYYKSIDKIFIKLIYKNKSYNKIIDSLSKVMINDKLVGCGMILI